MPRSAPEVPRNQDDIRYDIWMLENKDTWSQADYRRHDALFNELRRAPIPQERSV